MKIAQIYGGSICWLVVVCSDHTDLRLSGISQSGRWHSYLSGSYPLGLSQQQLYLWCIYGNDSSEN